jgi:hypothetical protein
MQCITTATLIFTILPRSFFRTNTVRLHYCYITPTTVLLLPDYYNTTTLPNMILVCGPQRTNLHYGPFKEGFSPLWVPQVRILQYDSLIGGIFTMQYYHIYSTFTILPQKCTSITSIFPKLCPSTLRLGRSHARPNYI